MISLKGFSQYDETIKPHFRSSACGPVTIFVILNYWFQDRFFLSANDLYRKLGTTPIGSFRFWMVLRLRRLLGHEWNVKFSSRLDEVIQELRENRPVAAKFDKYFTFHFFSTPLYRYHWVVLVGYTIEDGEVFFYFHDNGSPGKKSRIRKMKFSEQQPFLSFIFISPKKPLR